MKVELIRFSQPDVYFVENTTELVAFCARVSNPSNQNNKDTVFDAIKTIIDAQNQYIDGITKICGIHEGYYKKTQELVEQNKESVKGKHPSWINSHIRQFNRSWNRLKTKLPCNNCGYTKHVELAHIKAVSSFDKTTTLGEINSPDNVIQLCPNCHWEFDNSIALSC
jgi:predicted nucleic-acid-binding Zn-ribbon protein